MFYCALCSVLGT